jgi:mRNA interferase RelE/StbE
MLELQLSVLARGVFAAADRSLSKKLARCFERLEDDPFSGNNVKPLKGKWAGCWRYRVGAWRVVYEVDQAARVVNVIAIAKRSDVYE